MYGVILKLFAPSRTHTWRASRCFRIYDRARRELSVCAVCYKESINVDISRGSSVRKSVLETVGTAGDG